jgi:hypothetical protein
MPRLLRPALLLISAVAAVACAPAADAPAVVPPGAHIETSQARRVVLRGTAAAHPGEASCDSAPSSAPVYLQVDEETEGSIVLRPIRGAAVLRVEELTSNRTWCVMQERDAGAAIPGYFPQGVYAIRVENSRASDPTPFEVVFERTISG